MSARGRLTLTAVCAALLLLAAPLEGQQRRSGGRRGAQDREQLERRIRAEMGRLMSERLGLSEEQADRLSEVVQGYERRRRELFRIEQGTRRDVEELRRERPDDEGAAAELLERMVELRSQEAALFSEEQAALLEVLSPTQVLELQALREQIGRRIRALRGGRGNGPGRSAPAPVPR